MRISTAKVIRGTEKLPKQKLATMVGKRILEKVRKQLMARAIELRRQLHDDSDGIQTDRGGDVADQAFNASSGEVNSRVVEQISQELGQIGDAIDRIANGSYGICVLCGGKILAARLEILPYSISCVKCQASVERRGTSQQRLGGVDFSNGDEPPEINIGRDCRR
jgi:DnaK suppressor protein